MNRNIHPFAFLIFTLLFLGSCATSSDTVIVIQDGPRTGAVTDDLDETESFFELTVGLMDPVRNFDPLFAENLSTKKVLSLLYEGLFSFNSEGEIVPLLAQEVNISEDGLEYVITLNRDRFYHDSPAFTAGLGRRIHALDVKWAFERAARSGVPTAAADLLMGVLGFENYYLEQRMVYDPQERVLGEVTGIIVPNAETIVIQLIDEDPDFLRKLASPYLFIYPREALSSGRDGLSSRAVGTGLYTLSRISSERELILTRDNREHSRAGRELPQLNRILIRTFDSETALFQSFAREEIDWIPELGPELLLQVTDEDYTLLPSYREPYSLMNTGHSRVSAFYLSRSTPDEWLSGRIALLTSEDLTLRGSAYLQNSQLEISDEARPRERYFVPFTDNLVARSILNQLNTLLFLPESSLAFFDIRVPTRRTSIHTVTTDSFHQKMAPVTENYWLRMDTPVVGLFHPHVTGIRSGGAPWSLPVHYVRVNQRQQSSQ
ncbi:MAG: hypothetical protein EA360_09280 [Balneolaceae bacterium]|nr:MAG: hypothetical protein EA360_09280 [Balneolaceae bacterium]